MPHPARIKPAPYCLYFVYVSEFNYIDDLLDMLSGVSLISANCLFGGEVCKKPIIIYWGTLGLLCRIPLPMEYFHRLSTHG
jgi:hypothetical protein